MIFSHGFEPVMSENDVVREHPITKSTLFTFSSLSKCDIGCVATKLSNGIELICGHIFLYMGAGSKLLKSVRANSNLWKQMQTNMCYTYIQRFECVVKHCNMIPSITWPTSDGILHFKEILDFQKLTFTILYYGICHFHVK